jgi:hypothetical protein
MRLFTILYAVYVYFSLFCCCVGFLTRNHPSLILSKLFSHSKKSDRSSYTYHRESSLKVFTNDGWGNSYLKYPDSNSTFGQILNWNQRLTEAQVFSDFESLLNCNKKSENVTTPLIDVETLGLSGRWIEDSGNYLLPPSNGQVVGVIHFLGGAFVGAAPHLTYRYLLENLAERGYLIVATPYRLAFDYITTCDEILTKFDAVGVKLANMYGAVPVIGLGHSCGALLQTLITSLFPEAPRAVNILISFNNRAVDAAIPLFEEVVIPLSEQVMGPSDESAGVREAVKIGRVLFNQALDNLASSALAPKFVMNDIVPFIQQSLEIVDQFPPLLQMIAQGTREFDPSPKDTAEICKRMYRVRSTLLVKFENDNLDDTEAIQRTLREANDAMKKKSPEREMDVDFKLMSGTHLTPLTQNIILDPPKLTGLPGSIDREVFESIRKQTRGNFLKTVDELTMEVVQWLDKQIKV